MLVTENLSHNEKFLALGNEADRQELMESVVQRADGVFLWVALVLDDLEDGLFSGDNLRQLHNRITPLPRGLEDLFWQLLRSVHASSRNEVYAILLMATACPVPWPIIRFSIRGG
ncbi:uncharacterized protein BDV17DRAFT_252223 [Aspergillus undulatus]|uniref:uncharacterized protein n=1 Tax=Aspergillus undulatus TaxID=1810928 RepID=UPI003CCE007C